MFTFKTFSFFVIATMLFTISCENEDQPSSQSELVGGTTVRVTDTKENSLTLKSERNPMGQSNIKEMARSSPLNTILVPGNVGSSQMGKRQLEDESESRLTGSPSSLEQNANKEKPISAEHAILIQAIFDLKTELTAEVED
ncbi:hypothetical protein Mal35_16930 [Gimesia maris]|uniref:hypothetical protein n=1 Tax=Gimesia maris TaxID=122 RepID=UPI00118A7CBF|nr:hypothetical protein [Gimesia maris]QDT78261.1 hypothetical protein Mal35_16930 [Gimesia maris]